tara:strand:- start:217 stop:978 length:762 start_codon:yes stop_codon:yes gene_type:complete
MSTILNTLKKLEEEKSVLEQTQDIQGMVTQIETGLPVSRRLGQKSGWIAFFTLAVICASMIWSYINQNSSKPEPVQMQMVKDEPQRILVETPLESKVESVSGIPMNVIPEHKLPVFGKKVFKRPTAVNSIPSVTAETSASKTLFPQNLKREDLSASVKVSELLASVRGSHIKAPPPSKKQKTLNGNIPGLSIKGIIFFGPSNPANYIIGSNDFNTKLKLKLGDKIQGAKVESIESNQVHFSYNGKQVAVGMGK